MPTIFLSYAAADRARVQPLVAVLEAQGFDVWWDRDISFGESYHRVIEQALRSAACAIVVWSHNSVGSEWVTNEASEARRRGILVPALLDEVEPPLEFRHLQAASLFAWQGASDDPNLQQLVAAVRRVAQRDGTPPAGPALRPVSRPKSWWETPAGWAVGAAALLVAISLFIFVLRGSSSDAPSIASGPTASTPNSAEPTTAVRGPAGSTPTGPVGAQRPAGVQGGTGDLLDLREGAQIVASNEAGWKSYLFGKSQPACSIISTKGFVVFAFRDERPARFDRLGVFIEATNPYNIKTVELQASPDSEHGPFQSVGTFVVPNFRNERQPFHEFTFAPVTARYVKLVVIDWQEHDGPNGNVCTMQLLGTLQ